MDTNKIDEVLRDADHITGQDGTYDRMMQDAFGRIAGHIRDGARQQGTLGADGETINLTRDGSQQTNVNRVANDSDWARAFDRQTIPAQAAGAPEGKAPTMGAKYDEYGRLKGAPTANDYFGMGQMSAEKRKMKRAEYQADMAKQAGAAYMGLRDKFDADGNLRDPEEKPYERNGKFYVAVAMDGDVIAAANKKRSQLGYKHSTDRIMAVVETDKFGHVMPGALDNARIVIEKTRNGNVASGGDKFVQEWDPQDVQKALIDARKMQYDLVAKRGPQGFDMDAIFGERQPETVTTETSTETTDAKTGRTIPGKSTMVKTTTGGSDPARDAAKSAWAKAQMEKFMADENLRNEYAINEAIEAFGGWNPRGYETSKTKAAAQERVRDKELAAQERIAGAKAAGGKRGYTLEERLKIIEAEMERQLKVAEAKKESGERVQAMRTYASLLKDPLLKVKLEKLGDEEANKFVETLTLVMGLGEQDSGAKEKAAPTTGDKGEDLQALAESGEMADEEMSATGIVPGYDPAQVAELQKRGYRYNYKKKQWIKAEGK